MPPPWTSPGSLDSTWTPTAAVGGNQGHYFDPGYIDEGYFEGVENPGPLDSEWTKETPL